MRVPRESEGYEFSNFRSFLGIDVTFKSDIVRGLRGGKESDQIVDTPHAKHIRFSTQRGLGRSLCSEKVGKVAD